MMKFESLYNKIIAESELKCIDVYDYDYAWDIGSGEKGMIFHFIMTGRWRLLSDDEKAPEWVFERGVKLNSISLCDAKDAWNDPAVVKTFTPAEFEAQYPDAYKDFASNYFDRDPSRFGVPPWLAIGKDSQL